MGVHCYLIQIPERVLMGLDEGVVPEMFRRAITSRLRSAEQFRAYESAENRRDPIPALWLEKRWWRLHFFLTGKAEELDEASPLSRAILGGKAIGRELQQGPARYLWADEVREIAAALAALPHQELRRRFDDPAGFMRAGYDDLMKRYFSDETLDESLFPDLLKDFDLLAGYYRIASDRGHAMLLGLT